MQFKKENKYLEYKEAKNSLPKDFWETYSAFANTEGGVVILGIGDDLEVVGVKDVSKLKSDLFTTLNNPQKVSRKLIEDEDIEEMNVDGKILLKIFIKEADINHKPIYLNENPKHAWIRDFETDRKATQEELKVFLRNARDDMDSDLLDDFDIFDLDEDSINEYKIILSKREPRYLKMTDQEMLEEIGAFKRDRTKRDRVAYKLTIGGLLFFGKYQSIVSAEGLQHFHLDYFNYINASKRWSDRVAPGEAGYSNINIFTFHRIVLNKLITTIKNSFELDDSLYRMSNSVTLEEVLREALINSLIHADYFSDENIRIEAHPTYYKFFNPGKMKISVEEFVKGGNPKPRNNTITTLFRKIGISERAGSGGPEIFAFAKDNKLNKPDVQVGVNSTNLKIWMVDLADAHPELSEQEKQILKVLIKEVVPVPSSKIKESVELSKYYFDKSIRKLLEEDLIVQSGQGKGTKYSLKVGTVEHLTSVHKMVNIFNDMYIKK